MLRGHQERNFIALICYRYRLIWPLIAQSSLVLAPDNGLRSGLFRGVTGQTAGSRYRSGRQPPSLHMSSKGPEALLFSGVSREHQAKLEVSPPPTAGRGRGRLPRLEAPRWLCYRGGHLMQPER